MKYFQIYHQRMPVHRWWLNWILMVATSGLSVALTTLLYWVIDQLSLFEEHETKTRYEASYLYKAISAIICNQIINICVAHWILKIDIWSPEGLAIQVVSTLIIWYITQVLYHALYLSWFWRWLRLKWNHQRTPILKFQNRFNQDYQLPSFPMTSRYSSYLSDLYFLCFFGYLTPLCVLLGLVMFLSYYLVDRINVLKRSSFHPNYSFFLIDKVVHLAQSSVVPVCMWQLSVRSHSDR